MSSGSKLETKKKEEFVDENAESWKPVRKGQLNPYEDNSNHLWCKRCQRGVLSQYPDAKTGEDCPICLRLAQMGEISESAIGILKTVATFRKEHEDYVEAQKKLKELRQIRSIKDAGDLVKEEKAARLAETAELKAQIAELKAMLKDKGSKSS